MWTSLNAPTATLLTVAMMCSRAEATDCTKTPDLLKNCDQWIACVNSSGVGCYTGGTCYTSSGPNCL